MKLLFCIILNILRERNCCQQGFLVSAQRLTPYVCCLPSKLLFKLQIKFPLCRIHSFMLLSVRKHDRSVTFLISLKLNYIISLGFLIFLQKYGQFLSSQSHKMKVIFVRGRLLFPQISTYLSFGKLLLAFVKLFAVPKSVFPVNGVLAHQISYQGIRYLLQADVIVDYWLEYFLYVL